jgi:hypothetical protein
MFNPSAFAAVFYPTKLKHAQPSCPDLFRASTSVFSVDGRVTPYSRGIGNRIS